MLFSQKAIRLFSSLSSIFILLSILPLNAPNAIKIHPAYRLFIFFVVVERFIETFLLRNKNNREDKNSDIPLALVVSIYILVLLVSIYLNPHIKESLTI